ncbi:alpha/beta fold hydrolase [Nocardioides sp. Kera G14]|uniref:alpha/beta fold hydrolase n=1 Tax=Nocardioides sp. Kera G14 TaxID=2884264 RepID=UPI001D126DCB|nr:alpha/beta hydrolase [Nocardioides sp. Kera G14]UDY24537.1 alpha/beta hydrolase [Nocardioides sp. Kera G14]
MRTPPSATAAASPIAYYDVLSDDGTVLRAWTNDPDGRIDGPTVVLCNGLATTAWSWPALLSSDCEVRVVSWNHRGTGGSERPADPTAVGVDHFVEDALSVMDHFGITKTVLVGWSMGVNTMFELAAAHPERVSGLFAVAGVPGNVFAGLLGPLGIPAPVTRIVAQSWSRSLRRVGPLLSPLTRRLPISEWTIHAISRTGLIGRMADTELAALALAEFLTTPVDWYFHLALRSADHRFASLRRIKVPVQFVGGTFDLLSSSRRMASAAAQLADAEVLELRASHFIPLEQPDRVHRLLVDFVARVNAPAQRP